MDFRDTALFPYVDITAVDVVNRSAQGMKAFSSAKALAGSVVVGLELQALCGMRYQGAPEMSEGSVVA